jgi:hypothetical protein
MIQHKRYSDMIQTQEKVKKIGERKKKDPHATKKNAALFSARSCLGYRILFFFFFSFEGVFEYVLLCAEEEGGGAFFCISLFSLS